MTPIEMIDKQLAGGEAFRGQPVTICLIGRGAFEKMRRAIPASPNELHVDTIYGIPFEVFDSPDALVDRSKELHGKGKSILIIDE